jgi:glucose/arabinose dehydrogenase
VLFRQRPKLPGGQHFGGRIAFSADGAHVFLTLGDRGAAAGAQDPASLQGKVVRLARDGAVPADNPFVGVPGAAPEAWSAGHRNPQAAAIHPASGQLWIVEHGAMGGDEVNAPRRGLNYGWPVISYGRDYGGGRIGEGTAKPGLEQPLHHWDPSIAPSGMAFVRADRYPGWRGSLLVGALVGRCLVRLDLDGERVARETRLLGTLGERIRDVREAPDGTLWLLTDADDGTLLRLDPA